MKKTKAIKRLFIILFAFIIASPGSVKAQALDHLLGEVLVQFKAGSQPDVFIERFQKFEGRSTRLKAVKQLSVHWKMWRFRFDHNVINEIAFLRSIRSSPLIENAQFNFFIDNRTVPDDFNYPLQWYLNNSGQSGGIPGVDLDAQSAWATTQGGVTANGDTIVICIVDEDFDLYHEDLFENVWINRDEIPDNGIDDDDNDIIDDYFGFNAVLENGDVSNDGNPGQHGTRVAGISGAVGNNGTGISGINWHVKLMLVSRGNTVAESIIAYDYPFSSRKEYNETNSEKGAFVVATNSSWGIDYGWPSEAPLWCAMYDSLGSVGILSAAATTNSGINVDLAGDLPSTCPSPFLIVTTRVDQFDTISPNAGFGPEHVDLGAFGTDIWTTEVNNGYGPFSGTSAAAPQVAGAIGLLYAVPCPSFAEMAVNQPEMTANLIKDYLLQSTEANFSLENITLSGGRLNLWNSLQLLVDECDFSGCFPPYTVLIDTIMENSAQISWLSPITTTAVHIRYKKSGELNWTEVNNINSPFIISDLEACSFYEYQLASECESLESNFSASYTLQTKGCCQPPGNFSALEIDENTISLVWDAVPAANSYNIRYRVVGGSLWTISISSELNLLVPDLLSCTPYEFQIQSICSNGVPNPYSESLFLTTIGCGACQDLNYCNLSATEGSLTWISQVNFSALDHTSGSSDTGYSDYSDLSAELIQGYVHELNVQTGYELIELESIFNVWIDFDQNGVFNENEEHVYTSQAPEVTMTDIVFIPPDSQLGSTRMRIAFLEEDFAPCGTSNMIGEVEDYCVNIIEPTECLPPVAIDHFSNTTTAEISWSGNLLVDAYSVNYRETGGTTWYSETTFTTSITLENLLPCTDYVFYIYSICNGEPSSNSPEFTFRTKGCGTCLDQEYCEGNSAITAFEWIESVHLNTLNNQSGNNEGYAFFHDHSTNLEKGESYSIVLTAGFSADTYEEFFNVWIDFNQNGAFEEDEIVLSELLLNLNNIIFGSITIPESAEAGSTRMRVVMKYQEAPLSACETDFSGEIEEYCINITESDFILCPPVEQMSCQNPGLYTVNLEWAAVPSATSYLIRYQQPAVSIFNWEYIATSNNYCLLENLDSCAVYHYQIKTICPQGLSEFSPAHEFETLCSTVVSSSEFLPSKTFYIYPNPIENQMNIRLPQTVAGSLEVQLYDVSGTLIDQHQFDKLPGQQEINMVLPDDLSSGLYIVKARINGQPIGLRKIVKL